MSRAGLGVRNMFELITNALLTVVSSKPCLKYVGMILPEIGHVAARAHLGPCERPKSHNNEILREG